MPVPVLLYTVGESESGNICVFGEAEPSSLKLVELA
jgi:hypothetical protein